LSRRGTSGRSCGIFTSLFDSILKKQTHISSYY
jgi:hypothetical protein